ncbi:MAG: hypothetical protein JWM76_2315 [Pseudonocardiales bacterium]|nr:hypothetical protein [Pseudonocardiales bacterium]
MQRKSLDRIISSFGISLVALLLIAGGLLTWAHNFVTNEVHTQLAAEQIYFPAKDSAAVAGAEFAPMRKYAGQQLTTGKQAQTYADHFIAIHLKEIGGGKTYSQLSTEAQANPTDTKLAATVNTMFKGETLRGLLLNAYAFGTMALIAGIAAIAAFVGAGVLLLLSLLGIWHSRRVTDEETIFSPPVVEPVPVA